MTAPFLIIDGYNLMHAAGIARRTYGPGVLEQCRSRLNRLIVSLLKDEALQRATVVYDAFESPSNEQRELICDGLRVIFAPMGSDADSEIERMLRHHSSPKQVVVVSGDHRLHKAAARRKASCVDSEDFLSAMELEAGTTTPATRTVQADDESSLSSRPDDPPESAELLTEFDSDYLNEIEEELL